MGEIVSCTSKPVLLKKLCDKRDISVDDRISGLPNEILIAILSLLTLKEAAKCSVLSHRWKYLWTCTNGCWNFDATKTLHELFYRTKLLAIERPKYVNWVNQVLKLHRGPYIDELRIGFDLGGHYSREIDSWVNFAVEKGVQKFELDLSNFCGFPEENNGYSFPIEKFTFLSSSNTRKRLHSNRHITRLHGLASFCCLKSLCLKFVDVTGEVLEYFLANCLLLEHLCVMRSNSLVNLRVAGPSLILKSLEISFCLNLENMEISALNLVSFAYDGKIMMPFKDVPPLLSNLDTGGKYCESLIFKSQEHFSFLSQLETLKLKWYEAYMGYRWFPLKFPELSNLKHLELFVRVYDNQSLLCYTSLIKAAPLLSRFKVKLLITEPFVPTKEILEERRRHREARKATKCPHQCLRVVELVGFVGCLTDIGLALHLFEIAVSLEKMIIEFEEGEERPAARKRAEKLRTKIPPGAELVIQNYSRG